MKIYLLIISFIHQEDQLSHILYRQCHGRCWYIPDCSWNAESLWSWRGSADPWSNPGYHPFWEAPSTEWEESIIVSLYKGKGVALEWRNYWGLKLLDQVIKVLERMAENFLRQQMHINDMQFGHLPGRSTYSLYTSYKKCSVPSTWNCTWPLSIWNIASSGHYELKIAFSSTRERGQSVQWHGVTHDCQDDCLYSCQKE